MNVLILSSSPVHRKTVTRVDGLKASGAKVVVAGYRRENFEDLAAVTYDVVSLGFARNRDVIGRVFAFPAFLVRARRAAQMLGRCDIIWVNSLDMLVLAIALRPLLPGPSRIVYDVADLSPRQLSTQWIARIVRGGEHLACRSIDALIVTSPWFYWRYYRALLKSQAQVFLLENKISPPAPVVQPSPPGPPWRIVWHGLLRCRQSLEIIAEVAAALPDTIDVHAWGYIDDDFMGRFSEVAAALPNVHMHGPYSDTQIGQIFDGAHFLFAFDLDDGENSRLLLPNRLYHGAARALPLLAVSQSAVGRTAETLGLGVSIGAPYVHGLIDLLQNLTLKDYDAMRARVPATRRAAAVYTNDFECILGDIVSGSEAHCLPREEDVGVVLADWSRNEPALGRDH